MHGHRPEFSAIWAIQNVLNASQSFEMNFEETKVVFFINAIVKAILHRSIYMRVFEIQTIYICCSEAIEFQFHILDNQHTMQNLGVFCENLSFYNR